MEQVRGEETVAFYLSRFSPRFSSSSANREWSFNFAFDPFDLTFPTDTRRSGIKCRSMYFHADGRAGVKFQRKLIWNFDAGQTGLGKTTFVPNTQSAYLGLGLYSLQVVNSSALLLDRVLKREISPLHWIFQNQLLPTRPEERIRWRANKGKSQKHLRGMPSWYQPRERSMNHRLPFHMAQRHLLRITQFLLLNFFHRVIVRHHSNEMTLGQIHSEIVLLIFLNVRIRIKLLILSMWRINVYVLGCPKSFFRFIRW